MTDLILGCDISKDDVYVCLIDSGKDKVLGTRKFSNSSEGLSALLNWVKQKAKDRRWFTVMEATGVYHENCVDTLYQSDIPVYVVTPKIIKHYIANLNRRYKNDKSDAYMIACFGMTIGEGINKVAVRRWKPFSPLYQEMRSYSRQIISLQKSVTQFKNRLSALKATGRIPEKVLASTQEIIETMTDTIDAYKEDLRCLIRQDESLSERIDKVWSIKGVGWLTAIHVICATDGFSNISNSRQLTAFAGLDVPDNESGRCRRPGQISKCGSVIIRRALYMPALSSSHSESGPWRDFYARIYSKSGGKGKKAITAVMRKMLCLIYTLWKNNTPFDPGHIWKAPGKSKSDVQEAGASFVQNKKEEALTASSQDSIGIIYQPSLLLSDTKLLNLTES